MVVEIGSSFPSTLQAALLSSCVVLFNDNCDDDVKWVTAAKTFLFLFWRNSCAIFFLDYLSLMISSRFHSQTLSYLIIFLVVFLLIFENRPALRKSKKVIVIALATAPRELQAVTRPVFFFFKFKTMYFKWDKSNTVTRPVLRRSFQLWTHFVLLFILPRVIWFLTSDKIHLEGLCIMQRC